MGEYPRTPVGLWGWLERLEACNCSHHLFVACQRGEGAEVGAGVESRATPGPHHDLLLLRGGTCYSGVGGWGRLPLTRDVFPRVAAPHGKVTPDSRVVGVSGHLFGGAVLPHRKSDSGSTSGGSKSQSRSRSRSDSPPRQAHRGAPYKGSKVRSYRKSKDCKYPTQKPHKSRSRSSSRSRSRSRERADNSGKYKKKSHYYRDQRRERSRSYERTSHRYERDHPGHSRHRR